MPRFYVLDTEEQANEAVNAINARARYIYRAQGYTLETDGDVIGHRASDGQPQEDATKTETWDIPRQRLDGKWVVAHAETCPGNAFPIDAKGTTVAMFVGQDLVNLPVEIEDPSWWPQPDPIVDTSNPDEEVSDNSFQYLVVANLETHSEVSAEPTIITSDVNTTTDNQETTQE